MPSVLNNSLFNTKTSLNASISTINSSLTDRDETLRNSEEFNSVIRSIVITRAQMGATINEIKKDYYELIGEDFPATKNPTDLLLSVPLIHCAVDEMGCRIFYMEETDRNKHIIEMVKNQKISRKQQEEIVMRKEERIASIQQEAPQAPPHLNQQSKYQNNVNDMNVRNNENMINNKQLEPIKNVPQSFPRNKFYQDDNTKDNYYSNNNNNKNNRYYKSYRHRNNFHNVNQIYSNNGNNFYDNFQNRKFGNPNNNNFNNARQQPPLLPYDQEQLPVYRHRSTPINDEYNSENDLMNFVDYIYRNNNNNNNNKENISYFEDNYKYLYNKIVGPTDTTLEKQPPSTNMAPSTSSNSYMESDVISNYNNPFRHNNYYFDNNNNNNNMNNNRYGGSKSSVNHQHYQLERERFDDIAHIYDYQLLGDDFFLALARAELGCKLLKNNLRHQSGLAISGLTIQEATFRVLNDEKIYPKIIVNIGSVDILQEHHLLDIQQDFLQLLIAFKRRNIKPILTTLAPLANCGHKPDIKRNLEYFNDAIRNSSLPYIDIWTTMVNQHGQTYYDCYQSGARYVTGSVYPHVLWNSVGRQRILNKIKSELPFLK